MKRLITPRAGRFVGAALAVAVAIGAVSISQPAADVVEAAIGECTGGDLGAGGEYHPVTPTRLLDTRKPALDTAPAGKKASAKPPTGGKFDLAVLGRGSLPTYVDGNNDGLDDRVLGVMLNVTITQPTGNGHIDVFGSGLADPETSTVNFVTDQTVANSALVRPGRDGKVTLQLITPAGVRAAHVVVDVMGYISSCAGERGARLELVNPGRIYDSRTTSGKRFKQAESRAVPGRGADGMEPAVTDLVPNDKDISALLVNVTIESHSAGARPSYVSLTPTRPSGVPETSTINFVPGNIRSALAIVPLGADGNFSAYNRWGEVNVIIDVLGYMIENRPADSNAGRVVPIETPQRVFDTRFGDRKGRLGVASAEVWSFDSIIDSVRIGGQKVGAQTGLFGNLTIASVIRQYPETEVRSYVSAYPPGANATERPELSNVSFGEGESVPNQAVLKYGKADWVRDSAGNQVCLEPTCVTFFNRWGYTDYLFDATAVILAD